MGGKPEQEIPGNVGSTETSERRYRRCRRSDECTAKIAMMGAINAVYGVAKVLSVAFNTMKDFDQANVNLATILRKVDC